MRTATLAVLSVGVILLVWWRGGASDPGRGVARKADQPHGHSAVASGTSETRKLEALLEGLNEAQPLEYTPGMFWGHNLEERIPLPPVQLAAISGRVVDGGGNGVNRVRVELRAEHAPNRWREYSPELTGVSTTKDGTFEFPRVPHGRYTVTAVVRTTERDMTYPHAGVYAGSEDVVIQIRGSLFPIPTTIKVTALMPDGSALPQGKMWLGNHGAEGQIQDGRGDLVISNRRPPPGDYYFNLLVTPADGLEVAPTYKLIDLRKASCEIHLDTPRKLSGIAFVDGVPGSIELYANGVGWTPGSYKTRSAANGQFVFEGLAKGEVEIGIKSESHGGSEKIVVPTDASGVEVHAYREIMIPVEIRAPKGKKVQQLEVQRWRPSSPGGSLWSINGTQTYDSAGTFETGPFVPGASCELTITGTFLDGTPMERLVVPFVASSEPVVVQLRSGGEVSGRVEREDGSPVSGATVYASRPEPMRWDSSPDATSSTETDDDGNFRLTGIPAEGAYLQTSVYSFDGPQLGQVGAPRFVTAGETAVLVLGLTRSISGVVVDKTGKGFYGITVESWPADNGAPRFGWLPGKSVRGDGTFRIDRLAPGRHVVYVWSNDWDNWRSKDGRYALATVDAGESDVRLVLREGKTVEGRVVLEDGSRGWGQIRLEGPWGLRRKWPRRDGRFRFLGVPPGVSSLEVRNYLGETAQLVSDVIRIEPGSPPVTVTLKKP